MMGKTFVLISLALLAPGFGAKITVSPVQKVVQLLDDFKAKVQAEGKAATDDFAQYGKWCDDEADSKTNAIKDTNVEVGDLNAAISDAEGTISTLESKIAELTASISATEGELSKAAQGRDEGHGTFESAEGELAGTVDTLGHDYALIKKEMGGASFAQGAQKPSVARVQKVVDGLKQIVEASWVTTHEKKAVTAFLQQKADSEDAAEDLQPAYQSSSGGILDTISDMEEKAGDSLGEERKQEMKDQNAYQLLKLALDNELKGLKEELAKATSKKQFTVEELASAQKSLAAAQKGLAEDQAYLKDLKHECQAKAATFEEEYKDRENEMAVLGKAKAILAAKFSAFIQTSATARVSTRLHSFERESDERKEAALKFVHKLGKSLHSTVLVALSYRALADPFAKVKGMIEDMIAKLLQEAAEEASHKAFCDKEMSETKASMKNKGRKLDTVNARIEKSEAAVQELTGEVATLSNEITESDTALAEATKIRGEEKASFQASAKDYSESQEACAAAIEVLRGYYESGSFFLQMRTQTRTKARASMDTEEGTGDASAILGLLEVAESDFSKLLAEAKVAEEQAIEEYNRMATDSKVLKATKTAEVKAKNTQIASIKATLMDYSSDKDGLSTELDAVVAYLDKLKPQCETKVPSYEERAARREKEISGLKEALEILSGDGVPVL